jgi:transcriptional regulator GlxA family with amidase domain
MERAYRQQHRPLTPREALVREAERIMEESFGERNIGVEQVARLAGVSVSTLRAAFAEVRQCPPRETLARVRLRHALTFLRTSDLTLDATARLCGFDSASHLSRRVKESTGVSPGRLRGKGV